MNSEVGMNSLQNSALQIGIYSLVIIFLIITVYILFFTVAPAIRRMSRKKGNTENGTPGKKNGTHIPAGDSAAIAAAIFLFMDEIHDNENRVVTIKRVSRTYSPWNSKIYGVNWLKNR